ncbi:phage holin family protein [Gryllotalpicola sp.]|uniref:phage holin family protein n=1 Tax=Gryllotalpicola sp. TaxID=1932787 RepID=UPI002621F4F6|nr:phage holin family protein [Gryllotalpicola sp.]
MRFVVKLLVGAFALWLTTVIVGGISVTDWTGRGGWPMFWTYLLLAAIFGIVNAVAGTVIKIALLPLYLLTLGLVSFFVNAFLLFIVMWLSNWWGFGLHIAGFWWGVLGALVLGVVTWLAGLIVRPLTLKR